MRGTDISFGTAVVFSGRAPLRLTTLANTYDVASERPVISYSDGDDSDKGKSIVGTVSGTTISFGTAVVFESGETKYISSAFDSNSNKVVIAYQDDSNSDYGTGVVTTTGYTTLTTSNFLGIADEAISDTATGVIVVQGGTATYPAQPALNAGDPVQFEPRFRQIAPVPLVISRHQR